MPHDHGSYTHCPAPRRRAQLLTALGLAVAYMLAEAVGGWFSGSLALLADAGHMLSDAAALGLSLFAVWIAGQPASSRRTFGYHRAEVLSALVNAAALLAISGLILFEAWQRWRNPQNVDSGLMLGIAAGGLAVNLTMLAVLHSGRQENLNLRGAWLHVLADTLGSVAVIAAALALRFRGWTWVDPAASAAICLLIVYSSWRLLRETVHVLMEGAPASISVDDVRECLLAAPGVRDVHCLHVWTISSGLNSLSAHVVFGPDRAGTDLLAELRHALEHRFPVGHITLQLEPEGFVDCADAVGGPCQIRSDAPPRGGPQS